MIKQIIPGVIVEVVAGEREAESGVSGVVAMPLVRDWGDTVTVLRKGQSPLYSLGHRLNEMKLVNEVMKYADELILYRLNAGTKASGTLAGSITATAVYGGKRGNDISVTVKVVDETFVIKTFLGTVEMDSQTVKTAADFQENGLITITGTGTLTDATVKLTNGADGDEEDYDGFFAEMEKHEYNILAYTGSDKETAGQIAAFVQEQRAQGNMVQAVLSGYTANNKAIYNNTIGGRTLEYELSPQEACATMAGILAHCGIKESATGFDVTGWTETVPRLNRTQMEQRTQNGEILFVTLHGAIQVLYDKNSLTTFTETNPEDWGKGLVVRTLDRYVTDLQILLDTKVKGKERNSADGRNRVKSRVVKMTIEDYQDKGYVEGFTPEDVTVVEGSSRDAVDVTVGVRVVDSIDKIYVEVISM